MLGVMAEVSCAPVPPKTGIPSSTHPGVHRPHCHRDTHLRRRDPTVLALHGEALGREKRGISGEPGGDHCLRSLPPGAERLP